MNEPLFRLRVGERYRFNFPGAPGSIGTFIGYVVHDPGAAPWIALELDDDDVAPIRYYNLANLNALVPESDPRV